MYLQSMLRLVVFCFLAAGLRAVQSEKILSFDPDKEDLDPISTERRRFFSYNILGDISIVTTMLVERPQKKRQES